MATGYLSIPELVNAPTGIDWKSLPQRGATATEQLAEQTQIIARVSDRMDELAEQTLHATVDTEELTGPNDRLTVKNYTGEGRFLCSRWPILSITSGQWVPSAATYQQGGPQWQPIQTWQMRTEGTLLGELATVAPGASGVGPVAILIAPGIIDWSAGRDGFRLQVQYVNGWPNCGITQSVAKPQGPVVGDTSIHVDDVTGWNGVAGRVYDAANTESISVMSATPDVVGAISGPGLLNLSTGLQYAHAPRVRISAMPATLQLAGLLLATAQALTRGATAIAAQSMRGGMMATGRSIEDLSIEAEGIISLYKRIW